MNGVQLNRDGMRALARIRADRDRIRTEVINDTDAQAALEACDQLLATDVRDDAREWLEKRKERLTKVLAARRRVRGLM